MAGIRAQDTGLGHERIQQSYREKVGTETEISVLPPSGTSQSIKGSHRAKATFIQSKTI